MGNRDRFGVRFVILLVLVIFFALSSQPAGPLYSAGLAEQAQAPQQAAAAAPQNLPRVFLFATGGTISNRSGGRLTVEELIQSVPNLDRRVKAEGEQFANVSSGAITMEQWVALARQ